MFPLSFLPLTGLEQKRIASSSNRFEQKGRKEQSSTDRERGKKKSLEEEILPSRGKHCLQMV